MVVPVLVAEEVEAVIEVDSVVDSVAVAATEVAVVDSEEAVEVVEVSVITEPELPIEVALFPSKVEARDSECIPLPN